MRVLVIDPKPSRREPLVEWLRAQGHDLEVRDELDRGSQVPETDLLLVAGPDMLEVCATFRRSRRARWILAQVSPAQLAAALEAGANDCVLEPTAPTELAVRLQVAISSGALARDLEPDAGEAESIAGLLPRVGAAELRAIFDAMPVPVGIVDEAGTFVQCNRELERAFRQPPGTIAGRALTDFFISADVGALRRALAADGVIHNIELQLLDRYGNDYWVAGDARWIPGGYVIGTFTDITERRLTEEALRQSEASLRSALQTSPDGIIVHGEGRYIFINPAAVRQLGFDHADELMRTSIFDRVHPGEVDSVRERMREMMRTGDPAPARDIQFVRRDDEIFVGEVASIPATFDGVPAIISIIRDVSEQRRLQSQLFLADRLATVGTLAVGVAHEINNPLSWVMGNLGLLADEFDKQVRMREDPGHDPKFVAESRARVRELLGRAQEGTERVRRIVRDLGRFARPDAMEDETVDLHALLDSTIEIADVQIRHRARLTRDYRARTMVRGSEARLGQVFLNLLVNAGQAIEAGAPRHNRIHVATRSLDDGRVEVEIRDTGCGIPPGKLGRIFDPFFTTKPPGEGTGIGLAISHSIVTALGGEVLVESTVGEGTCFRVRLPPAELRDPSRPAQVIRDTPEPAGARRARVLIADDEPLIREMVSDALAIHDVETVATGREALERILAEDWDLILCDLIMPELTGVELWERLTVDRPQMRQRLVFMTGGDFSGAAPRFPNGVKVRRLEKPFSIRALRDLAAAAAKG